MPPKKEGYAPIPEVDLEKGNKDHFVLSGNNEISVMPQKICIIGGGVAGLTAARVLRSRSFQDITLYEAAESLGGVWATGYPKFAIQTPGDLYEFPDKELSHPKDYKDGLEIKKYSEDYAEEHGILKSIRMGICVTSIESTFDGKWAVSTNSKAGSDKVVFDFVVLATGVYSPMHKHIPTIPGMEHFKGKVYHSEETAGITDRAGKRSLVVGFGKSAQDCAMNAFAETGVPPTLLFRSAHWCVPRKILGLVPMEWLLYSRFGQGTLPSWQSCGPVEFVVHRYLKPLIWFYWRLVQGILISQLGLWGGSSHLRPTLSIEDDMYCGHGVICHPKVFPMMHKKEIQAVKGQIKRILQWGAIELNDGTTIQADEIIFATGFDRVHDFLPKELLDQKEDDGFYCYRQMLVPGCPNIAFLNSNVTTFSNITTAGIQSAWLAELLKGSIALPSDMEETVATEKKWRRDKLHHAGNARAYLIQLHQLRYYDQLLSDMGANVKRKTSWILGPIGASLKNFFAPMYSSDYKSIVTGEWRSDPVQIKAIGYKPSFLQEWVVLVSVVVVCVLVANNM